MKSSIRKVILVAWIILIFVLTGYPSLESPKIKEFPMDKAYHFVAFFVLGFFAIRLFKAQWFFILCFAVVIVAEIQQVFIPGRSFEILDIVAGIIGFTGAYLIAWLRRRYRHDLSKA